MVKMITFLKELLRNYRQAKWERENEPYPTEQELKEFEEFLINEKIRRYEP